MTFGNRLSAEELGLECVRRMRPLSNLRGFLAFTQSTTGVARGYGENDLGRCQTETIGDGLPRVNAL
jgi:hypothetical protein